MIGDVNVNANPKAVPRQALKQVAANAPQGGNPEAAPLMGDVALVVETLAAESAVKRFTPTEEERRQARLRESRNRDAEKKRLLKKEIAKEEEEKQLRKLFDAKLVVTA